MSKPPKIKLSLRNRKRALDLLAKGYTIQDAAENLRRRHHPNLSVSHVIDAYFVRAGPFSIASMQGKSREEIEDRYVKMKRFARQLRVRARKTLASSKQDPVFAGKWLAEARRRIALQRQDPAFREASAKGARLGLVRLRKDPQWMAGQSNAVKAFWKEYRRLRATEFFEHRKPTGWEGVALGRKRVLVHIPDIEASLDTVRLIRRVIDRDLSPLHRFLVCHVFGIEAKHSARTIREAASLSKEWWRRELNAAYETLKQNHVLKELIEE